MELKICHLYPDLLNLYADRGNLVVLARRCKLRGIEVSVKDAPLGAELSLIDCDILLIGGGQDADLARLLDEIHRSRGAEVKAAIEDGIVALAVGGGYQLLGHSHKPLGGEEMDFIGALDYHSVGIEERLLGDYLFQWDEPEVSVEIVGFENHSAKTYLGSGVRPFGKVLVGHGNNGEDGTEGARYRNVFGSYAHGPLLPKNPQLADWLIRLALERKYGSADLQPLDDTREIEAHRFIVERLTKK